jgi:hypothetical protein
MVFDEPVQVHLTDVGPTELTLVQDGEQKRCAEGNRGESLKSDV